MVEKYNANHTSKKRKLYVIAAVVMTLGVSTVVLAWVEGFPVTSVIWTILLASWSWMALRLARKSTRFQENVKTNRTAKQTHGLRMSFIKTSCIPILLASIALFVMETVLGRPLNSILASLWMIIVNGSELVFVRVVTDESV